MKQLCKTIAPLVALMFSLLCAENLVQNSDFLLPAGEDALFWSCPKRVQNGIQRICKEGKSFLLFASSAPVTPCIRQYRLHLVPGEKYRLAFDLSTEGLSFRKLWCVVANYGWELDAGIKLDGGELKTDGIQHFETECVMPARRDDDYSIALYLQDATGSFKLYKISLEPLTEKGRLHSHGDVSVLRPDLGILALNRMAIPHEQNQLDLALSWIQGPVVTLQTEVDSFPLAEQTFIDGRASVDISAYKKGIHHLHLRAVQNGRTLVEREEYFAFAPPQPEYCHPRRGLSELLLEVKTDGQRRFEFILPDDGRCFIRILAEPDRIVSARLDDSVELYPHGSYRNETIRLLARGKHAVTLLEPVRGKLQVRAVPVVLKDAGISQVVSFPAMPPYDWEWHKRHSVGRCANFGPNGIKADCLEESRRMGLTYGTRYHVNRFQSCNPQQAEKTLLELNSSQAILNPDSHYVEMDEFEWGDLGALLNFADISNRVSNPHGKEIMHWIASKEGPCIMGTQHYILEQLMNMGGGKGLLVYELYFGTRSTEAEARKMISDSLASIVEKGDRFFPGLSTRTMLCFANMNHPTFITSALHPNVNFKYFLDLEMNLLANSPAADRIAGVGYWGGHYADEDVNLWTQELYRHYCCDGRTDLLSDQYGYAYIMPYLRNGDFSRGLEGYTVKGEAFLETIRNYSKNSLRHWDSVGSADTVAVLSPGTTLETTAVQLDPASAYKLEYICADYEDVMAETVNPKRIPLTVELANAEIIARFDKVDDANRRTRNNVPRIHVSVQSAHLAKLE